VLHVAHCNSELTRHGGCSPLRNCHGMWLLTVSMGGSHYSPGRIHGSPKGASQSCWMTGSSVTMPAASKSE
jgi:hypothetical protein